MTICRLLFWNAGPHLHLAPAEVARELGFGEEVEGLIDLPVKEILDKLKLEFPQHDELPGVLQLKADGGAFEATWTWQHVRVECRDVSEPNRQRLIDAIEAGGCMAYDAGSPAS